MSARRALLVALVGLAAVATAASAAAGSLEAASAALAAARLEPQRAVAVEKLSLNLGPAVLAIERGTLWPVAVPDGRVVEVVLTGRARLVLEPADEIEAGQLELFTGSERLDAEVTEAVLTVASDAALAALFGRPPATGLDPGAVERALDLHAGWRDGPLRRRLGVAMPQLADAIGDPLYDTYFCGWFLGGELGDFALLVEPDAAEPVTLGQFVPFELDRRDRRRVERQLHRSQRQGRLIGMSVDDLGQWDTWVSSKLVAADGVAQPSPAPFEPRRYGLDLTVADGDGEISGRARVELTAAGRGTRAVRFGLYPDLAVTAVRDGAGATLEFAQTGGELLVALPEPPASGAAVAVEIDYHGRMLEKVDRGSFVHADTLAWYPHAGQLDLAAYDVTFHWPAKLDLLAGGRRVDGGEEPGGRRWERRVLERPVAGYSFELGRFKTLTGGNGEVAVTLAFEPSTYSELKRDREELLALVVDCLELYGELFGAYPLDELTVVTTRRDFSQAMLGFVTLSSLMVSDDPLVALLLGLEDRRTVVAHEIAHQWWGHQVGWVSYRDQWISEAMANYSALLYARRRLGDELRFARGPTAGWQAALLSPTADGRPVESLGPVVLGERLVSSRSDTAYEAIVYRKGAVVLDMLSRLFGEDRWIATLRELVTHVSGKAISTESFFRVIERLTGVELDDFTGRFVFATGLPEVYYDYRFEPGENGKWHVRGVARQRAPYRYLYRVVPDAGGGFDVVRRAEAQTEIGDSLLAVPFDVVVDDPAGGSAALRGRLLLRGERTDIDLEIEYRPRELFLDRRQEVFGRFFNERRYPKRMLYYQGLDSAADGDPTAAQAAFREALTAAVFTGSSSGDDEVDDKDLAAEGRRLDSRVHLQLARLHLDAGRLAEARAALETAQTVLARGQRDSIEASRAVLESRLDIKSGKPEEAFARLRKAVLRRGEVDSVEAYLLLAVAARQTGHDDELERALGAAAERGGDASALTGAGESPVPGAPSAL